MPESTHNQPTPKRSERWLTFLWLGGIVAVMLGVLGWCGYLQMVRVDDYRARAEHQQRKLIPQAARRGLIVDREGRKLAVSRPVYSLAADPCVMVDPQDAAEKVAAIVGDPAGPLAELLLEDPCERFVWLRRHITDGQAEEIKQLGIRGLVVQRDYFREYPMGTLAAHVVGFTAIDGSGLEGVEASYEQYLSGVSGLLEVRSDVRRRPQAWQSSSTAAQDGLNVVLTIDSVIQSFAEEQLRRVVEKFQAAGACALVMDPHTGELLALANYPSFDPSVARSLPPEQRRNRALTDPVEPGSTFKPFTAAAALQGEYVQPDEEIDCKNGHYAGRGFGSIKEYNYHRYGMLTVGGIIMRSSNIGSAILAQRMGKPYFYRMVEEFGFGRATGLDLPGEGKGILRPLSEWNDKQYTLTRAAFGQAIAVTPIQLIRGFCTFANGGRLVRPRVVRGVVGPDGEVVRDFIAEEARCPLRMPGETKDSSRQVISSEIARLMTEDVLAGVVARQGGTARNASLEGYQVFGKTGTAQVPKRDGRGYEENKYVSSFIAGVPAYDPAICVLVMVREPDRSLGLGYTGGRVAAEPVREIMRQSLAYLGIRPQPVVAVAH